MIKLRELISTILLSSTLLLSTAKAESPTAPNLKDPSHNELIYQPSEQINEDDYTPKLILKKSESSRDSLLLAGHRSHRSHSSHRSHYSSRSGGSYGTDRNKGSSSTYKYKSIEKESTQKTDTYKLGNRVLVKGMKGPDVLELKKLLIAKGYKMETNNDFDEFTEVVVKDFQSKRSIMMDGKAGPLTIYYLKKR